MTTIDLKNQAGARGALLALSCAAILAGCGSSHDERGPDGTPITMSASVARTSNGVVHVQAKDFRSLGYGAAYAYAEDNLCMFADSMVTVRGERAKYFGATAHATVASNGEYGSASEFIDLNNEDSDFFYKGYLDPAALKAGYDAASPEARDLLEGYAAGYNRYLKDHAGNLPAACQGAAWVRPITVADMQLMIAEKAIHASGEAFAQGVVDAARSNGGTTPASPRMAAKQNSLRLARVDKHYVDSKLARLDGTRLGSNGLALGKAVTANGRGMLLGNPHFPWTSTDRFYQLHLTVPGKYDAMGVSLGGLPVVMIGFNKDVAWTHTVTTAKHLNTFMLTLDPSDSSGTTYLFDGKPMKMTARQVSVESRAADGSVSTKTKTFYSSAQGAVIVNAAAGVTWSARNAVVLADPNRYNTRLLDQWLGIGRANNVVALKSALDRTIGLPWVNTVAADRDGFTLYADASVVPNIPAEKFGSSCLLMADLLLFDGSSTACAWTQDSAAPGGIVAPANAPFVYRSDAVGNSNGSYWLSNPGAPIQGPAPYGFSPLYGPTAVPQSMRTRLGFKQVLEGVGAAKKFGLGDMQEMVVGNRVYTAELMLPDVIRVCLAANDAALAPACAALQGWDKRNNLDSRGAVLFREFWNLAARIPGRYAVLFNPADPINTPNTLAPAAETKVLAALRAAVQKLQAVGVPLDGKLGDYQSLTRNGVRIPIHGGIGDIDGSYNATVMASDLTPAGYTGVLRGVSYIQTVTFDDAGPVAQGILVYGQSTNPTSPYYADQTALYSRKQWPSLPFAEAAIKQDAQYKQVTVAE